MKHEDLSKSYLDAVRRVLEESAFVFVDPYPCEQGTLEWPERLVSAELSFSGPISGTFILVAPLALCESMAEDMLGDAPVESVAKEAIGEILNMIGGVALDPGVGDAGVWNLGLPQVKDIIPKELYAFRESPYHVCLSTEMEEPVEIAIRFDDGGD